MRVVRLAAPAVLILRPIVDQQQEVGRRQALDQAVEQGLRLGVDPVQVLEHQQQGLHLAFPQQHALEASSVRWRRCGGSRVQKRAVVRHSVQERQQGGESVLERLVERQHLAGDLGPDGARVIAVVHMAVAFQQVNDGEVGRGLAVGHRGTLQHAPALGAVGVDKLMHQARLPHTCFPHQGDHLAVARLCLCQGLVERLQLLLPPYKRCQAPRGRRLQAPAEMTGAHQLKHLDGLSSPFTGTGPRAVTCTRPSTRRRVAAVRRMLPGVANCSMRAARCVVSRRQSSPCADRCQWRAPPLPRS